MQAEQISCGGGSAVQSASYGVWVLTGRKWPMSGCSPDPRVSQPKDRRFRVVGTAEPSAAVRAAPAPQTQWAPVPRRAEWPAGNGGCDSSDGLDGFLYTIICLSACCRGYHTCHWQSAGNLPAGP